MATPSHGSAGFFHRTLSPLFSFLPFGRQGSYLSLDIGSSSVKMLEVQGSGSAMRVLNAGIESLPAKAVHGNMVQDVESVAFAIRTLLEDHRVKATHVITAVPGPAVVIKRATFPTQEPRALRETVLFEAGNFIPESLDDVNLDFQVLDHDPEADNIDVLLVAVRKDMLEGYVSAISETGLIPVIIDVDYFALENMFEANYTPTLEETIALINVGAHYSSINIMKEGHSAFTGDVPVGGQQFTTLMAQRLGVSEDRAEELKVGELAGENPEEVQRVITLAAEQFLDEVQRALSFFWTGSTREQISTIYLSGGTAQLSGLATAMYERLQIPVEVIDPFRLLNVSSQVDGSFLRHHASSFAVCVGLATRRPGDK